jgi:adenine-specific DNA methylase
MANDTDFTLSLFDSTALSSWNSRTLQAVTEPDETDRDDADDADQDGDIPPPSADPVARSSNFHLAGDRALARGWPARARDNIAAINLSKLLEQSGRAPTADEQEQLLRFIGFGATDLAQNCFRRPGEDEFRSDWEDIGAALEAAVTPEEYAALRRATQYAHYTPETIIRGLWRAAERLGFTGGRVLEPGMGTGLFFALLPEALRETCQLTGIEYDPITSRIARFVHPEALVRCEDYARSQLNGRFDLVIGNPPFSDRLVRADPVTRSLGLRLHDYFIARSIARLRPGGIALFVTSIGTMDKTSTVAREHIAGMADLIGAVRLPEGSMRASAGTEVVIDVLVFQRRADGEAPAGAAWIDLAKVENAATDGRASRAWIGHEFSIFPYAGRAGLSYPRHPLGCVRFGPGVGLRERVGPRHARARERAVRGSGPARERAFLSGRLCPAPENRTRGGGRRHNAGRTSREEKGSRS